MWLQLNKWLYRDHLISNEMIYKNKNSKNLGNEKGF